jgi:hydroxymethylpyrimidine/phosphomethylpyrimidine kinase
LAIASFLALQIPLNEGMTEAKNYFNRVIQTGKNNEIGQGHGPEHYFYKY